MATRALVVAVALTAGLALAPDPARAAQPCCEIRAVDATSGEVTARDLRTGVVFRFPASESARRRMTVGQRVDARFIASAVEMSGRKPVCRCGKKADGTCWCQRSDPSFPCYDPFCPAIVGVPEVKPEMGGSAPGTRPKPGR